MSVRPGSGGKPRAPGLDGIRALAVLAVMAFHEGLHLAPGGFLGVDVFFVLSGFLITDLLVARKRRSGDLGLRTFWGRRARRLLPALAVVLVVVTAAVAVIEPAQMGSLRPALTAAVTYSSNWYQDLNHVSYWQSFGPPPPLQHLWSLAIEEQFYLAWPLVLGLALALAGRAQRGWVARWAPALVAAAGAVASATLAAVLYTPGADPSRVYYGTDTHASALLIGAALALTWPLASLAEASEKLKQRLDVVGVVGLAVLAWCVGHFGGTDPAVYPAGLVLAALAAACLTAAAAAPGMVARMLGHRVLRWLGIRSYGIYLWHWPVIALATAVVGSSAPPPGLWVLESVVAIGLAALSWRWLEEPILRNGFRPSYRNAWNSVASSVVMARWSPARALPAIAAFAALSVAWTAGYGVTLHTQPSSLQQQIAAGARVSADSQAGGTGAGTGPAASRAADPAPHHAAGAARPAPVATPGSRVRGRDVTAIGDSVMLASAQALTAALPGIYINAVVSRQMSAGLAVVARLAARGRLRPVVVVGLGTNGTVTSGQVDELLRLIGPDRKLVLINTFEARPWETEVNDTLGGTARRHSNVALANWHHAIEDRTSLLYSDGVHPMPPGARVYARVVAAAIQATGQLTGAGTTSPAPPPLGAAGHRPCLHAVAG